MFEILVTDRNGLMGWSHPIITFATSSMKVGNCSAASTRTVNFSNLPFVYFLQNRHSPDNCERLSTAGAASAEIFSICLSDGAPDELFEMYSSGGNISKKI